MNINSWQVVKRRQWVKLPIPNEVIERINTKAKAEQPKFPIANERLDSLNEEESINDSEPKWNYEPDYFQEEEIEDSNGNEPDYFYEEEYELENTNDIQSEDQDVEETTEKTHGYNLRKTPQREAFRNKFEENVFMIYFNVLATYNIKKAVEEYGNEGTQSMLKEMKQLHDKDVFEPMDYNSLNERQKSKILRSLMFVKRINKFEVFLRLMHQVLLFLLKLYSSNRQLMQWKSVITLLSTLKELIFILLWMKKF